jgi:hypothetical protein
MSASEEGRLMSVSAREAANHFYNNQRMANDAIGWYQGLRNHCHQVLSKARTEAAAARLELARAYFPSLDQPAIDRAEKLTGFRGLSRRSPLEAMAHEKAMLDKNVARIGSEQAYQDRFLVAGADGTLTTKLIEARELLEPWAVDCQKYEALDGFLDLVAINYDTPRFEESWWQPHYWKHWAQGDWICEALGVDDFGDDVLPAYQKTAEQRAFWQGEVGKLEAEIQAVHDLVKSHDEALARLPQLPALYLQQCQALLAEYLFQADYALLEEWLRQDRIDRAILVGLRKCAGLEAKEQYLVELDAKGLSPLTEELTARAGKYARKGQKYLRPKYAWQQISESSLDQKFAAKHHKLSERHSKLAKLIDRIDRYDDYQRFDLTTNEGDLWWYELTRSRPPRMVPSTRAWYERNPDLRPDHDEWEDETEDLAAAHAVAELTAARREEDVGYLS